MKEFSREAEQIMMERFTSLLMRFQIKCNT